MLDTAMLCNCSGIRTRSVVNEYENMCQSCHKQIRDDRNVVRDRNLREVMVLSGGSEDDEPVYENPVDSRVKAARSNKNSESNQTGSETDGEVQGGDLSYGEDLIKRFQTLVINGDKEGLHKLVGELPPRGQADPKREQPPLSSTLDTRNVDKVLKPVDVRPRENVNNHERFKEPQGNDFRIAGTRPRENYNNQGGYREELRNEFMRREDLEGQRVPQSQSDLLRAFDDAILGRTIRRSNKSSWKIELPKFSG